MTNSPSNEPPHLPVQYIPTISNMYHQLVGCWGTKKSAVVTTWAKYRMGNMAPDKFEDYFLNFTAIAIPTSRLQFSNNCRPSPQGWQGPRQQNDHESFYFPYFSSNFSKSFTSYALSKNILNVGIWLLRLPFQLPWQPKI